MGHHRRLAAPLIALRDGVTSCENASSHPTNSLDSQPVQAQPAATTTTGSCDFKLACWLDELGAVPLDDALAVAKEVAAEYVWFTNLYDEETNARKWIWQLDDEEIDAMVAKVSAKGLKLYQLCTLGGPSASAGPFHNIRLEDVPRDFLNEQRPSEFAHDLQALIRTMEIAARTGVGAVLAYSLSWSGEWQAHSAVAPPSGADPDWNAKAQTPTFGMRWATHGGIISEGELDRLVAIFRYVTDKAEQYGIDLVLAMRPFHFVSCARNFATLAARVGSPRLKVQWSPADCLVSNECDYSRGFELLRPYLHGIHCKDVTTGAGPLGDIAWSYSWCPLGNGEVNYVELLRLLAKEHSTNLFLGVCTHFRDSSLPDEEQNPAAMRESFRRLRGLLHDAVES